MVDSGADGNLVTSDSLSPGLVSVVIPCYRQAHYLASAIESVMAQSHPAHEIIVVDDGSPDDVAAVVAAYPKVRHIRKQNAGVSAARNTGLGAATGEYISFLDADDMLHPDALRVGASALQSHPEAAFTYGRSRRVDANGEPTDTPILRTADGEDHYTALLRGNFIILSSTMYRASVFGAVGGFDPSVSGAEDYELYLRITSRFPVHDHRTLNVDYRRHDASASRNAALLLRTTLSVLRRQRQFVQHDPAMLTAYQIGMRDFREYWGWRLSDELRRDTHARKWGTVATGATVLLRHHPAAVALALGGTARRIARRELSTATSIAIAAVLLALALTGYIALRERIATRASVPYVTHVHTPSHEPARKSAAVHRSG